MNKILISNLKVHFLRKDTEGYVSFSNINLKILKILYLEGLIRGFKKENNNRIKVFLKYYNGNCLINKMKYINVKRNNKFYFLTLKKIKRFFGLKNKIILSTNAGLLTNRHCIFWGTGGRMLLII